MKLLTERFVQNRIIEYLSRKGWSRNLRAKGLEEHGVDIIVRNNKFARYWLIECKGDATKTAKYPRAHRENSFNLALGQIITRMNTHGELGNKGKYIRKYGVGFPEWYRELVKRRLPYNVAYRLNLFVFLVAEDGSVELLDWKKLRLFQKE